MSANRRKILFDPEPPPKLQPHINVGFRWLCGADLCEVARIESGAFEHPKSMEELELIRLSRGVSGLIAEYNGYAAGFVMYGFNRGWLEVHDLAVRRELWGHGVGRQMMDKLRGKLEQNGRYRRMTMTLRETNTDGLCYLRACGWKSAGFVREYYGDTGEGAIIMAYQAGECEGRATG